MKQPTLRYKTHRPYSGVKMCAIIMFVGGVLVVSSAPFIGFAFMILGIFPFIMYEFIEFDLYGGLYREGICIAGMAFGKAKPYPSVHFIYLKRNRTIYTDEGTAGISTSSFVTFDGYLRMADGYTTSLMSVGKKEKALKLLQQMAHDLQVEMRDLTEAKLL
ncbi:hypothetical protein [Pontibacter harenae]|uniref:hypothetical protein n=1 Tax=Pontibacter harenae TaxID=2894083 RepID=UPI001E2A9128|nr:hypothetical protein [Pontibacter harenae]MCC9168776.1 hypothetical protein [Pontibacter harenae]